MKQHSTKLTPTVLQRRFLAWLGKFNQQLTDRYQAFLSRRPHRSFQRTRRRDYARPLHLPSYIAFTVEVTKNVVGHRRIFVWLMVLYALVILVLGGITNQDTYAEITTLVKGSSKTIFTDGIGKLGQAGLLLVGTVSGSNNALSAEQQAYLVIVIIFVWLTTVWLLRELLLGRRPKLRDGLYNAGAPFIATLIVVAVLLVQLLPIVVVGVLYAGLLSIGVVSEGFGAMLFWVGAAAVSALVLYWVTSTLIALVVVTLPGMYPFRALRAASDLVVGWRLPILYRWLWGVAVLLLAWIIIMLPIILLDGWLKDTWQQLAIVPVVPVAIAVMMAVSVVWFATYVYLLYRKVVDDHARI